MNRPSANQQSALIAIALLLALVGVAALVSCQRGGEESLEAGAESDLDASGEAAEIEETWTANLYFPSGNGLLYAEPHEIAMSDVATERIAFVVTKLLTGPYSSSLQPPLPDGVGVRKVYLTAEGIAYLDLESADDNQPPAAGSTREMLALFSLVNSVLLNVDEVERLVLLWNGRQQQTFAGHLDTRGPLAANVDLIARAP